MGSDMEDTMYDDELNTQEHEPLRPGDRDYWDGGYDQPFIDDDHEKLKARTEMLLRRIRLTLPEDCATAQAIDEEQDWKDIILATILDEKLRRNEANNFGAIGDWLDMMREDCKEGE